MVLTGIGLQEGQAWKEEALQFCFSQAPAFFPSGLLTSSLLEQRHPACRHSGEERGFSSVQHGIQLVSQGIKHGADIIQDVLGIALWGEAFSILGTNALFGHPQGGCQGGAGLL